MTPNDWVMDRETGERFEAIEEALFHLIDMVSDAIRMNPRMRASSIRTLEEAQGVGREALARTRGDIISGHGFKVKFTSEQIKQIGEDRLAMRKRLYEAD